MFRFAQHDRSIYAPCRRVSGSNTRNTPRHSEAATRTSDASKTWDLHAPVLSLYMLDNISAATESDEMRVTLLGTGTPFPSAERFGSAILVEVAGVHDRQESDGNQRWQDGHLERKLLR